MLKLDIPAFEGYDERTDEFFHTRETTIQLEHSLVSLAKWESIWEKPFLNTTDKTPEESIDYIRCMTITQNVSEAVYNYIQSQQTLVSKISEYINRPMTATTIKSSKGPSHNSRIMTAELIYYDMFALNIPMECQKWHLNRLLMLIRVCAIESQPKKKMSGKETMAYNHALNKARRQKFHSKG